ncbi:MAG: alpha-galactosidase [Treponema sp.]|nr:alpha-galactosidase [Treponema sp.]
MDSLYRKTPLMGWASWNCFKTDISEQKMKEQAKALIKTGLAECGYTYLNMDDGFFGGRASDGALLFHTERFPNGIKPVADYAHTLGLQAGIYSDAGDNTCGHYYNAEGANGNGVGLYGHEEADLRMYLEDCGFDFIKVDWCGGVRLGLDEEAQYSKIGAIIDEIRHRTGRCIVYNICRWQFPGSWAARVADSWRTGADIAPEFSSVLHQLDVIKPLARYCSPGHVNDLDMMQIGNGMPLEDERTHFAMWCMMSTPLMIGGDLTKISEETLSILKNRELIAINQDSACVQAFVIHEETNDDGSIAAEIWLKDLGEKNSSEKAIAFLNRSPLPRTMTLSLRSAGLTGTITHLRNVTAERDEESTESITVSLRAHETAVFRVKSTASVPVNNKDDKGEWKVPSLVKISLEETKKLCENGAQLVDVRGKDEYEKKHLDGAINIFYADVHSISGWYLDKKKPVIVYCATGKRSAQAKHSLDYLGYKTYFLGGVEL